MTAQSDGLHLADVVGYVTAIYDGHWWLASVTNVSTAEEEMHLNFLHPHGPSRSYFFPQRCDTLHVHISNVITHVEPTNDTGRTYRISPEETRQVEVIMQRKCTFMAEWDTLVMMKLWRREVVSSIPDRGTIVR